MNAHQTKNKSVDLQLWKTAKKYFQILHIHTNVYFNSVKAESEMPGWMNKTRFEVLNSAHVFQISWLIKQKKSFNCVAAADTEKPDGSRLTVCSYFYALLIQSATASSWHCLLIMTGLNNRRRQNKNAFLNISTITFHRAAALVPRVYDHVDVIKMHSVSRDLLLKSNLLSRDGLCWARESS